MSRRAPTPTDADALAEIRARIETLARERDALPNARLSREETVERIRRFVADQGAKADPFVRAFSSPHDAPSSWPAPVADSIDGTIANVGPALALLMPEALVERLTALVDESEIEFGPSHEARAERSKAIDVELFEAEREEEQLVRRMIDDGRRVLRRPRINYPIVLVLRAGTAPTEVLAA